MKLTSRSLSSTAIIALLTATLATTALVPTATAQPAPEAGMQMPGEHNRLQRPGSGNQRQQGMNRARNGGGIMRLFDFGPNAERLEIALVRLAYAVELTEEQQALFDTLRTDALAAQADFATATDGLFPERGETLPAGERPDIVERFDNRLAIDTARLDAMTAVRPAFEAFFSSLTEDQLAELMPRRAMRAGNMPTPAAPTGTPEAPPAQ